MMVHIEHLVQAKEWRNDVLQSIVPSCLGSVVTTMSEWSELLMGSGKPFSLQMQPNFVALTKLKMLSRTMMGFQVGLVGGHQDPPGSFLPP